MSGLLYACDPFGDTVPDFSEQLHFQAYALFLRPDDFLLHFLQFRRHEPFGVRQRLLADISFRHLIQVAFGNFNIISEYFVILNPQIPDTGSFTFLRFQIKNPLFTACLCLPVFIQDFRIAFPDNTAFCNHHRCIRMDRPFQKVCQVFQRIQFFPDFSHFRAFRMLQQFPDPRNPFQAGTQCQTVSGVHIPVSDFIHQSLHVINAFEFFSQRHA